MDEVGTARQRAMKGRWWASHSVDVVIAVGMKPPSSLGLEEVGSSWLVEQLPARTSSCTAQKKYFLKYEDT